MNLGKLGLLTLTTYYLLLTTASAQTFSSTDFQVIHPVLAPGHFSSSAGFRLNGAIGQLGAGLSTSGDSTLNTLKAGFLYFTAPSPSPSPAPSPSPTPTPTPSPSPAGGGPILDIFKKIKDSIEAIISPCAKADLNCDGNVDIYDAAIVFYWWGKQLDGPTYLAALNSIVNAGRPSPDLNRDKLVDIFDLSVLLSKWTN
ncbi:MAG: hypothetical protein AAB389_04540 [Patescibacteria group bacterium]